MTSENASSSNPDSDDRLAGFRRNSDEIPLPPAPKPRRRVVDPSVEASGSGVLSPQTLQELGRVAAHFGELEHFTQILLFAMIHETIDVGNDLVGGEPIESQLDRIKRLAARTVEGDDLRRDVVAWVDRVKREKSSRNRALHAWWIQDPGDERGWTLRFRRGKKATSEEPSLAELRAAADSFRTLGSEGLRLALRCRRERPPDRPDLRPA